jgi:hypothetical protein
MTLSSLRRSRRLAIAVIGLTLAAVFAVSAFAGTDSWWNNQYIPSNTDVRESGDYKLTDVYVHYLPGSNSVSAYAVYQDCGCAGGLVTSGTGVAVHYFDGTREAFGVAQNNGTAGNFNAHSDYD